MNKKRNQNIDLLKEDLGLYLSISFGMFLFVLFFQPFAIERFDFNNRLIFIAGLGGIVFLIIALVRTFFRWRSKKYGEGYPESVFAPYIPGLIVLAMSSVSFAFYLKFVGHVSISFYAMFKIVLICFVPPVVLRLKYVFRELKQQNELLAKEKKSIQKKVHQYEEDYLNKTIEFLSENSNENLNLLAADVAFIKSADNYVEIVYKEGDGFQKKLLRNTLKNMELQLKSYSNFIRCHRICIVNKHFIEQLHGDHSKHWLTIKEYPEQIPVSRQYLFRVKEIF